MTTERKSERPPLTEASIVEAAITLTESTGPHALTFRRLGAALGVAPTAILRHFRDKDDLMLALGERLIEEALAQPMPAEATWQERLRHISQATRETFAAHPRVAVLVAGRTIEREAEFRSANFVLQALSDAGLEGLELALTYRTFVDTVLAWAAFEASLRTLPAASLERDRRAWVNGYAAAPASRFPAIHAVADELAVAEEADQFSDCLDLLIEAVQTRVVAARAR